MSEGREATAGCPHSSVPLDRCRLCEAGRQTTCQHAEDRWLSNDGESWFCQECGALRTLVEAGRMTTPPCPCGSGVSRVACVMSDLHPAGRETTHGDDCHRREGGTYCDCGAAGREATRTTRLGDAWKARRDAGLPCWCDEPINHVGWPVCADEYLPRCGDCAGPGPVEDGAGVLICCNVVKP